MQKVFRESPLFKIKHNYDLKQLEFGVLSDFLKPKHAITVEVVSVKTRSITFTTSPSGSQMGSYLPVIN